MPNDRWSGVARPAISGVGLGIMRLFIVAAGGFVFKRAKLQEGWDGDGDGSVCGVRGGWGEGDRRGGE